MEWFDIVSEAIGWTYFACWSISFYPQLVLNWRRKSSAGLSMDYLLLGCWGFFCYFVYHIALLTSEDVREEYRRRNNEKDNLIRLNDAAFSGHAFLLTLLTIIQSMYYDGSGKRSSSYIVSAFIVASFLGSLFLLIACSANAFSWLDLINFLGSIKAVVTVLKYLPQVWLNYKRKSTEGWSYGNVILDFTGGMLSAGQLFWDAAFHDNMEGIGGALAKFIIGSTSMVFDVVFFFQKFIYQKTSKDALSDEEEGFLGEDEIINDSETTA